MLFMPFLLQPGQSLIGQRRRELPMRRSSKHVFHAELIGSQQAVQLTPFQRQGNRCSGSCAQ
jgi:hypothetical protein